MHYWLTGGAGIFCISLLPVELMISLTLQKHRYRIKWMYAAMACQMMSLATALHMGAKFEKNVEKPFVEKYLGPIAHNEQALRAFNMEGYYQMRASSQPEMAYAAAPQQHYPSNGTNAEVYSAQDNFNDWQRVHKNVVNNVPRPSGQQE